MKTTFPTINVHKFRSGEFGQKSDIHLVLADLYERLSINFCFIDGRLVWFSNTSWQYDDEIPPETKPEILSRYHADYFRMMLNSLHV